MGFWSQLQKGAESWDSLIQKQLAAVNVVLQATEAVIGMAKVQVGYTQVPPKGVALTLILMKWGLYLE